MARRSTRRNRSIVGWLAAALGAASLAIVPAPPPAAAIAVSTTFTSVIPVTWVDAQGRQYEVVATTNEGLAVARTNADGTPDRTWGTADPDAGVRSVAIAPPTPSGTTLDGTIAADAEGILTTTWRPSSCSASATCDRWYARYDGATGEAVASPVLVEGAPPALRALRDGSLLTGAANAPLGWRGPNGSERDVPSVEVAELAGVDVSDAGDLLVATSDGDVVRGDITAASGCASGPVAIGAAADGGFAVACWAGTPLAFTVTRYDVEGAARWTSTGAAAGLRIAVPARVSVDSLDRVWVGSAASPALFPGVETAPVTIAAFTHDGPSPLGTSRATSGGGDDGGLAWMDTGGGIVDLRTIGDGSEVAYADLEVCCRYPANTSPQMAAFGAILPTRPGPPVCAQPEPQPRTTAVGTAVVSFEPCHDDAIARQPTAYLVSATWEGGQASATVDAGGGAGDEATLTGLPHGRLVTFEVVPSNDRGSTIGARRTTAAILPFTSVEDFVAWTQVHLAERSVPGAAPATLVAQLRSGTLRPDDAMATLLEGGAVVPRVEPVVRLYLAAFLRDPDSGGLDYWAQRRAGGLRLVDVADRFARSSEFVRRYGSLDDRRFVDLVYRNVLGRGGDPSGVAHWVRKLATGTPRGTVLAQFSESAEHVGSAASVVRPIVVSYAMLGRRPTPAERAAWVDEADAYRSVPGQVLESATFLRRWFSLPPGP